MKLRFLVILLATILIVPQNLSAQQGQIQLLAQDARLSFGAWSPDGQWIALSVTGKPPAPLSSGLYVFTRDGKQVTVITGGIAPGDFVGHPIWSPDSSYIKFPSGPLDGHFQTVIASIGGKVLSRNDIEGVFEPWRNDSKAFFHTSDSFIHLVATGLDGKEILRSDEALIPSEQPSLSPDGKTFALATDQGLVLLDAATFKRVGKFLDNQQVWGREWSPDGKLLSVLTVLPDVPSAKINIIDLAGKQRGSFEVFPGFLGGGWSPDGTVIAEINNPGKNSKADVTFHSLDGTVLARVPMGDQYGNWAPDNTYTILNPQGKLVAVQLDGTVAHDYGFTAATIGSGFSSPELSWSPNGKLLALAPSPSDSCCAKDLMIYNKDGKLLHKLTRDGAEQGGAFYWANDSGSLLLFEGNNGVWSVPVQ